MLKQAVVFSALLVIAAGFLERWPLEPIPEKFKGSSGCYIKELDLILGVGASTPSKERCVEYRCDTEFVNVAGCSAVAAGPPCHIVEDTSKLYPDCCRIIKCPENTVH